VAELVAIASFWAIIIALFCSGVATVIVGASTGATVGIVALVDTAWGGGTDDGGGGALPAAIAACCAA